MASPHFLLFPFMAQGHMIPMIDLAKLLAHQGAIVTIVTTPHNAARCHSVLTRAIHSGLQIRVLQLEFPCHEVGLPHGCENLDLLPSLSSSSAFHKATCLLHDQSEKLFPQLSPRPTCIVSDMCLPWTLTLAHKFRLPRLVLYSLSCFSLLCMHTLITQLPLLSSFSDSELVTFSDLPHPVQFRKSQLPIATDEEMAKLGYDMMEANRQSHGVIINTFEEMEHEHLAEYRKLREFPERVWCVGPVSLCNNDKLDVAQRGNTAAIDVHECVNWLDGQRPCSVVYVSLGSLCNLTTPQLIELGLGLEASNKPFIWVIRKLNLTKEMLDWMEEYDFEGRTKRRGLVIRGWAPQVMILSHSSTGCFLTHCGWNSSIEGMSAGVPMITWPLFADQVFNERLLVEIIRIGVSVGAETAVPWGEEEKIGVLVKRESVREAIEMAMDGDGSEEMRQRCKQLAEKAKRTVKEGGSSHRNLNLLIQDTVAQGRSCDNGNC